MNDIITNGTEIKQRILSEINNSKKSIYVAMAWFTDRDIATAIIESRNRGVEVDVILSSNAQNETVKLMFEGANVKVHAFETGDSRGIMHHKFCLLDGTTVINGSYNYSYNASNNNVENIHVSHDQSTYSQLLTEFERLKYNIDNRIPVNSTVAYTDPKPEVERVKPINVIESFYQQLNNLVYSATLFSTDDYQKKGFEASKESHGNIDIFRTEHGNIKEIIKTYATDDGLSSKKNVLTSNISNALQGAKTNLNIEKEDKISVAKRDNDLEKRQNTDRGAVLKQEKLLFESGNQNSGERGLLQINKEIEKNKLDKRSLEENLIVKKFWSFGTVAVILVLGVFTIYLSMFFGSAFYKMFYEGEIIRILAEEGGKPRMPKLVDGTAISKLYRQEGPPVAFIAAICFLFPIFLSNLKLIGSKNQKVNTIAFWGGLLTFDIAVAAIIAINTAELKSLLDGVKSDMKFYEFIFHGEFYTIFLFGMIPLIITHYFIENISGAYKNSHSERVDSEKNKKIQILDAERIELDFEKELVLNRIKDIDGKISENDKTTLDIETRLNNQQTEIDNRYSEIHKQLQTIFDEFYTKITSGKIFTEVIFNSVISAYKSGFVEYLPSYYSSDEVTLRVKEIEQVITLNTNSK